MTNQDLKLTLPTDFEIMDYMTDGKRHQASEIGPEIDKRPQYVRNRLAELRGHGLVRQVPNSTMYVLTERGKAAFELREQYSHQTTREFSSLVDERVSEL